jgi:hypothetical protein
VGWWARMEGGGRGMDAFAGCEAALENAEGSVTRARAEGAWENAEDVVAHARAEGAWENAEDVVARARGAFTKAAAHLVVLEEAEDAEWEAQRGARQATAERAAIAQELAQERAKVTALRLAQATAERAAIAQELAQERAKVTALRLAQATAERAAIAQELAQERAKVAACNTTKSGASERRHCARPGCSNDGLNQCGACKSVEYCSRDCQKLDWTAHKAACTRGARLET